MDRAHAGCGGPQRPPKTPARGQSQVRTLALWRCISGLEGARMRPVRTCKRGERNVRGERGRGSGGSRCTDAEASTQTLAVGVTTAGREGRGRWPRAGGGRHLQENAACVVRAVRESHLPSKPACWRRGRFFVLPSVLVARAPHRRGPRSRDETRFRQLVVSGPAVSWSMTTQ